MKIVAMLPTYNEAENIGKVIKQLLALPLDMHVLVVDDSSPDGTGKIVEELAKHDKRVHLMLRKENRGRGWAGIDGFRKALSLGADAVVEMDADLSHSPSFIPAMAEKAGSTEIVVGSRYVQGGKDQDRTLLRKIISGFARRYLSFVLGVKLADPTSGFRLFTRSALEKLLPSLSARDPFIVTEVVYYARKNRLTIVEVPIEFFEREAGESKLKPSTLIKYLFRVWKLKIVGSC
jgi:dolichol-phosphate mannosyltransferase